MKKYTSREIAKWFINRAKIDVENGGDYLTQLKLQKLMYYAKGFYYVFKNEPLFSSKISAQKFGPVVNDLNNELKPYDKNPIPNAFKNEKDIGDDVVKNILEFVYKKVAKFSAVTLVEYTHMEAPWRDTPPHKIIKDELISKFFRWQYLENLDKNPFGISSSEMYELITTNNLIEHREAFVKLAQ